MAKTREPTPARSRKTRSATVAPMTVRDEAATTTPPEEPTERAARERLIAERAYLRAEQRGFAPGGEVEDWLAAEREIDAPAPTAAS